MRVNPTTSVLLGLVLLVIFALAGWGHLLHLDGRTLDGVRAAASVLGALVLAVAGAILRKDSDGDGVPDLFQPAVKKAVARAKRTQPPLLPILVALALLAPGCGAAGQGFADTMRPVLLTACEIAEKAHMICNGGRALAPAVFAPSPEVVDEEPPASIEEGAADE